MNIKKINIIIAVLLITVLNACSQAQSNEKVVAGSSADAKAFPGAKPNAYWKKLLSPDAYEIMVKKRD